MRLLLTLGAIIAVFSQRVLLTAIAVRINLYSLYVNLRNSMDCNQVVIAKALCAVILVGLVFVSNILGNFYIDSIREPAFPNATKLLYKRITKGLKLN